MSALEKAIRNSLVVVVLFAGASAAILGGAKIYDTLGGTVLAKPPFECDGLHVLVIEDQDARRTMTGEQLGALDGADVRGYLNTNAKDSEFLSEQTDEAGIKQQWVKDAWAVYKKDSQGKLPWVVMSNGKAGTSQAYPGNIADALALLHKYGD